MHIIISLHLQNEIDLKTKKKQVSQQSSMLSIFLSAHVSVVFKIIVKLDYLER